MLFICDLCGKTYSRKSSLRRHYNVDHNTKFIKHICNYCNRSFSRKDVKDKHVKNCNIEKEKCTSKSMFKCDYCNRPFTKKGFLIRHLRTRHNPETKRTKMKQKNSQGVFECNECAKQFSYRNTLLRHLSENHNARLMFECAYCDQQYSRKNVLKNHITSVHLSNDNLACERCCRSFESKISFNKHVTNCFRRLKVCKSSSLICIRCKQIFKKNYQLLKHYVSEHGIELHYEKLEFDTIDQFTKWKEEIEFSSIAEYAKFLLRETKFWFKTEFRCHRSGIYKEENKKEFRIRRLKKKGSKKLQGFCPAGIIVKENKADRKCSIIYQTTHVGHEIGTENELHHMYLSKTKKFDLAEKMAVGIPPQLLLEIENDALMSGSHDNRKRSLVKKDLQNIRSVYNRKEFPLSDYIEKIAAFVDQYRDSILYFKNENENTSFTTIETEFYFNNDDFVLIFCSPEQKKILKLLTENRVVCFDRTHDANSQNYLLHTMVALNYDQEELPVAFALTNRNDELIMKCFIECIKNLVGEIRVTTFMSNMQSSYFNAWISVMSKTPKYQLFCTYHIKKEWKRNLSKVPEESQVEFYVSLTKLRKELDENKFQIMFDDFINQKEKIYEPFLNYFKEHFSNNYKQWACCYRKFSGVNTNNHGGSYFRRIKCDTLHEKRPESVSLLLEKIKKYLILEFEVEKRKKLNGYSPLKLSISKYRHYIAVKELNENITIEKSGPNTWYVISSGNIYEVRKQEPVCKSNCLIKCVECNNACLHEYTCSCYDHCIKFNMCKHIHSILIAYMNIEYCEPEI